MGTLKIPDRFKPGLSVLATMTDTSYEQMLEALKHAPASFVGNRELAAWLAPEVKTVSSNDVERVVETLTSLYRVRGRTNRPLPKIVEDIASSAQETIVDFKGGTGFGERLSSLLALDSLDLVGIRAKELQMQEERQLLDATILTDLRPVFGQKNDFSSAIIIHTLKINIHDSGSGSETHREIHIALDAKDIAELKKTLERAEEEALRLKSRLDAAGIRIVNLEEGNI